MPNWCTTNFVVEGEQKVLDSLYEMMDRLGKMKEPLVENGFGPTWLGCLLTELGEDFQNYHCKGDWYNLSRQDKTLRFDTDTAWDPAYDIINLLEHKFPTLHFYFRAEELNNDIFVKNDEQGKYFPEQYYLILTLPNDNVEVIDSFVSKEDVFRCINEKTGSSVNSDEDIERLHKEFAEQEGACFLLKCKIIGNS